MVSNVPKVETPFGLLLASITQLWPLLCLVRWSDTGERIGVFKGHTGAVFHCDVTCKLCGQKKEINYVQILSALLVRLVRAVISCLF